MNSSLTRSRVSRGSSPLSSSGVACLRNVARTRLQPVCFRPDSIPEVVPSSVAQRKKLTGSCVVTLLGKRAVSVPVPVQPHSQATLKEYMTHAAENFANIPLPMGGKLERISPTQISLVIPKMEIFDVWLQPRATSNVMVMPNRMEITSTTGDCVLDGSHHVKQMGLNERYNLDVCIAFTWDEKTAPQGAKIHVDGRIEVEVDIPAPFSFIPKGVLKTTGDAAMAATLAIMMPTFLDKLVQDYVKWAK